MSKEKAHLWMNASDIDFVEPTRVEGTKFWKIGTVRSGVGVGWIDTKGRGSSLSVRSGTAVFVLRKAINVLFTDNPTVKEAVARIIANQPRIEDLMYFDVTLEMSLPELFMRNQRAS